MKFASIVSDRKNYNPTFVRRIYVSESAAKLQSRTKADTGQHLNLLIILI